MKKLKFLLPILALSLLSCEQYLDVNDSPNQFMFGTFYDKDQDDDDDDDVTVVVSPLWLGKLNGDYHKTRNDKSNFDDVKSKTCDLAGILKSDKNLNRKKIKSCALTKKLIHAKFASSI